MILLRDVADLLTAGWTQHADARNNHGNEVDPSDPAAASWSLLGALVLAHDRMVSSLGPTPALAELAAACALLAVVIDSDSLPEWNDSSNQTQKSVLDALRQASDEEPPPPKTASILN